MELFTNTVSHPLQTKLQSLVSFLRTVTKGFDVIAEEIDNVNLKTAMITFASESRQYAKEICNYFQTKDILIQSVCSDHLWEKVEMTVNEQGGEEKGSEILALCNKCELYFKKLYDDILKEDFLYTHLKSIITCQLYAAKCAFMKIRLLNTLRFN